MILLFTRSDVGTHMLFSAAGAHLHLYLSPKARACGDSTIISRGGSVESDTAVCQTLAISPELTGIAEGWGQSLGES